MMLPDDSGEGAGSHLSCPPSPDEGGRCKSPAGLRSGNGPMSVRVRPSSLSVTVTTGQRAQVESAGRTCTREGSTTTASTSSAACARQVGSPVKGGALQLVTGQPLRCGPVGRIIPGPHEPSERRGVLSAQLARLLLGSVLMVRQRTHGKERPTIRWRCRYLNMDRAQVAPHRGGTSICYLPETDENH